MVLVLVPIGLVVLYFATVGSAQISAMTGKAHVGFLSGVVSAFFLPEKLLIQAATRLAKYIATSLEPAYEYSAKIMARFISGLGQSIDWNSAHAHRNSSAVYNVAWWAKNRLAVQIEHNAIAKSKGQTTTIVRDTAPSVKVQRVTSKLNAVQFRHALDSALPGALVKDYPQVNWGAQKWRRWLGVLPATGSIALPFPRVIPRDVPIPKAQRKENTSTNKRLKRLEKILGITGLSALVGATFGKEIERFLKCGNTRGIAKAWCGANLSSLLGLLGGLIALEQTFDLESFAKELQSGITEAEGLIRHFWQADVAHAASDRQLGQAS